MKTIRIIKINFIEFFDELSNLPHLEFLDLFENTIHLDPLTVITSISKCKQVKHLDLKMNITYIPKCISNMTNLTGLVFFNTDIYYKFEDIPNELLNLEKLWLLDIKNKQEFLINNNKMYIFDYKKTIIIPDNITELIILTNITDDIDNLPNNIEILTLYVIGEFLTNLPCNLKKLYIHSNEIEYWDFTQNKYIVKQLEKSDFKLPFNCEIEIFKDIIIRDYRIFHCITVK